MGDRFVIGSRGSKLALTQADWVKTRLSLFHPDVEFQIEIIKTSGDVKTDPLSVIGGKGVFTKELEDALLNQRIDFAVHSLKDLPTTVPEKLDLAAICEREDARDALVLNENSEFACSSLADLPWRGVVGTSSPRRSAQLRHLRSDLVIKDLRGNVDTRLRKLDENQCGAVILAAAGLRRLGFENRINLYIPPEQVLPAVGQGAIGIEIRADHSDARRMSASLDHKATRIACISERAVLRAFGGGCQLPVAAHCVVGDDQLRIEGLVASSDGQDLVRAHLIGPTEDAEKLGVELAGRLLASGAERLLANQ